MDLLAPGVFFTGMVKDFLCLPRPLSPPLQRITMSGLTALEYGFPSTHSTNAVSVALYALTLLDRFKDNMSSISQLILEVVAWLYAVSVVLGRIYCGMHGFLGNSSSINFADDRLPRWSSHRRLIVVGQGRLW